MNGRWTEGAGPHDLPHLLDTLLSDFTKAASPTAPRANGQWLQWITLEGPLADREDRPHLREELRPLAIGTVGQAEFVKSLIFVKSLVFVKSLILVKSLIFVKSLSAGPHDRPHLQGELRPLAIGTIDR